MTGLDLNLVDNIADAITRLRYLENKSRDDGELIELLRKQKDALAEELSDVKHNAGIEVYQAEQERDAAVKKAEEVQKLIEKIGGLALEGVRKIKGDEPAPKPAVIPAQAADDKRLPPLSMHR